MTSSIASSVVSFEDVSVHYQLPNLATQSFKDYVIRSFKREMKYSVNRALSGVSFAIRQGEVVGFVGQNGAGKSTILKLISRVIVPTAGRVVVSGRVAPLLELGAAFHQELSGRENIFLFGTLLGYSRRLIEERLASIIEFSELGEAIDSPFRSYSSGMQMRLGFSTATEFRPDILIIDEALTVGDEKFQAKCKMRIESFRQLGTTILIVSHALKSLEQFCDRLIWIDKGKVMKVGAVGEVAAAYREN